MTQRKSTENPSRRDFLRRSVIGGAGAAAVIAATGSVGAAVDAPSATAEDREPESTGYRLTRHIRDYYKTAAL
jgi:hypothetical protein